jgi:phosphoribosylformylglycinamidine cyclo-ligase
MWRTFNCGIGFTLIVPITSVARVGQELAAHGLASRVIGSVVPVAEDGERVRID